ncbi:MAG TPA: hypothetical protein VET86_02765 [Casimicrobiaceae bacterium]|jgi:hypothetical protein|nr:hypothetical protein [Casimicrobiaceae bacterium]
MKTTIRHTLCIALGALLLQALPVRAQDYTDIWWRAGGLEDGWGVTFTQNGTVIFATLFVHGPAPSTTEFWYVATIYQGAGGAFTGDLYQTTGTGIGAPWNPAQKSATKVGALTFTPTSSTTGTLVYNVGGIVVTKDIARQSLTAIALGGSYVGSAVVVSSGCTAAGSQIFDVDPVVTQSTGGQMSIALTFGAESCTMQGTYVQEGTLFRIPVATYACTQSGTTTVNTTATVYELKATNIGLEGRWSAPNVNGCTESASFAAVFP